MEIAPHLCSLQQLSLTGCPAVTHRGVFAVLRQNTVGIRSLSLEALPAKFNMAAFAGACTSASVLSHLRSFTLSIPSSTWLADISSLLEAAPLEAINLYAAQNSRIHLIFDDAYTAFWDGITSRHAQRLQRVSVLRMPIPPSAIRNICTRCVALKQLFVVVDPEDLEEFTSAVSLSRSVAEIHINFPQRSWSIVDASSPESEPESETEDSDSEHEAEGPSQTERSGYGVFMTPAQALALVLRFPESIQLFGCNSRVWKVQRTIRHPADWNQLGTSEQLVAQRELVRYDGIDIPEQFLVVRT
ncbi:F-box domain-containing protein [Mycena chlorophos]|uniref:F-box domain-containing protein n=1 Tax=Mycena chlorophos TaxID=658473 RepID=A0A8H6TNW8_MYCCL|nr:F-box domain-containing protein [Mycena chlorophos]